MKAMKDKRNSGIIFGLIIIFFGVAVLGTAFSYLKTTYDIGPYWPAILIFAGALSAGEDNSAVPFGLISVGALLLARNLGVFANNSPVGGFLFLLIGIGVLAFAITPKRKKPEGYQGKPQGY